MTDTPRERKRERERFSAAQRIVIKRPGQFKYQRGKSPRTKLPLELGGTPMISSPLSFLQKFLSFQFTFGIRSERRSKEGNSRSKDLELRVGKTTEGRIESYNAKFLLARWFSFLRDGTSSRLSCSFPTASSFYLFSDNKTWVSIHSFIFDLY